MPLSWKEIRHNAVTFAREWTGVGSERAEAKSFWDDFFKVFGIKRQTAARGARGTEPGGGSLLPPQAVH